MGALRVTAPWHHAVVATAEDLVQRGFTQCAVAAKTLGIVHEADVAALGPFCWLVVDAEVPALPGVYAWVVDGSVMYVGKSNALRQVVQGVRMQRAYNDYTYVPASKVAQVSNPRVRVNGLLNRAIGDGETATWWWLTLESADAAGQREAELIDEWEPPWNRARPTLR